MLILLLLALRATSADENDVYASDDNFVSPTQTADAAEEALAFAARPREPPPAVAAAAAAEYAAWAAPPPEQAPATPAGGLRVAAWPVTHNRTFPVDGGLPAAAALRPWGDVIDAPAGPGGAAAVAVVSAKPCAAAALDAANATCVGCGVVRGMAAGGAVTAVVFAGRRVRELAFRCDGELARTRLRVKAVRGGPRCALPAAAGRRVAWLAPRSPLAGAMSRLEGTTVRLGLATLRLARGARGLMIADGLSRDGAELLAAGGLGLEVSGACGRWERRGERLGRSGDAVEWSWMAESVCGVVHFAMRMQEASGYAHVNVTSPRGVAVVTRLDANSAPFAAGLGLRGGTRPRRHTWTWNPSRPLDAKKGAPPGMGVEGSVWDQFAWLGSTELGLKLKLLGDQGAGGPQLDWKLAPPYPQWASGDVGWDTTKSGIVVLRATTGDQENGVDVAFSLQTSPVQRLTARHMFAEEMRRFHAKQWDPPNCSTLYAEGVRAVTLHHGTRLNPYINYPFHDATLYNLGTYAKACAAAGVPVSLYYTHREISSHASELPLAVTLLNATDDAPLVHYGQAPPAGRAEGFRKKRQKLEARLGPDTFVAAWGTPIRGDAPHGDENDVAVAAAASGAWARFWVRGARYLRRCIGVAGFYLDGIAPPPATVAAFRREGGWLDLHAANKTAVYLELYPYLDSVWTGEASYLEGDANHYLVSIAGLQFGRPSQLLAGKLSKEPWLYYRALLFGMTERAGWSDTDVSLPRLSALWRAFDAVGVASADVVGFWRRDDARAVMTTACGDVKRTAFVVDGGAMVVVASWSRKTCVVDVSLEGLGDMVVEPNVPGLQCGSPPKAAGANITLTIEPKSGALFVVYGAALASSAEGLAGEGPCTQEKWWWSSPRKRGAQSLRPARRPAALPRRPRSRPARAPPAQKAPKSKEPKPKASLLARVGRLFRGDREAASGKPLGVGAVCYRFCEDGSRPSVSRRADCPAGTACRTTLPPDVAAFDSCGTPETCQKDQLPGPPARVDAARQSTGHRVDEALCGFADRAAPRFAPPTAPIARDDATTAEQGMRRLAADFLKPWRDGGIRERSPSYDGGVGPATIEIAVVDGAAWVRDAQKGAKRRRYEQARANFVVELARRLAPSVRGAAAFTLSLGDCVATRSFRSTDGCGRRPTGTYAPWQADARRPPPRPGAGPVLSHVACLDSNDVPAPFFHADARAKVATPKRTAACAARFARKVDGGALGAWDAHARALCEAGASMAARRRSGNATVLFRGSGGRSCWDAARKDVGRDGAGVCGRSLLFRGAGTERIRVAGWLDARRNHIPLAQQAGYGGLLSAEGHCGFADRGKHILWLGPTLFHQESFCAEYYMIAARPWVHYVPVSYTFDSLEAAIRWARDHPKDVATIRENARDFAGAWLSAAGVLAYFEALLAEIAGLVRYDVAALVRREAFVKAGAYLAAHHVRSN